MTRVPCEACCGSGDRELSQHEQDTLSAVSSEWSATSDISVRVTLPARITLQALSMRLYKLEALGLVERRPLDGQRFEWRTTRAKTRRAA